MIAVFQIQLSSVTIKFMDLKFIQVNIYKGGYFDALVDFLRQEKPDFISMQEVTTGKLNYTDDKTINLFRELKDKLGMEGVYNVDLKLEGDEGSTFGNAVLAKFPIVNSHREVLSEFRPLTLEEIEEDQEIWGKVPRHVLDLTVDVNGQQVHAMSWHGAWTAPPADNVETLKQAKKIAEYLKSLDDPFILGCDSNAVLQSRTIQTINEVATNLMEGSGILQTTHPKIHKIVPRGYLIDFIFVSPHFKLKSIKAPLVTVSDHLPVVAELELAN